MNPFPERRSVTACCLLPSIFWSVKWGCTAVEDLMLPYFDVGSFLGDE